MKKTYLIALLLICSVWWMEAAPSFYFTSLKPDDGLSQLSVLKIFQDSKGFMWFGTRNGLNKYDGNTFTVYKHSNTDSTSLSNSHITALAEDDRGNLWVGTMDGLNRLEFSTNRILSYNLSSLSDKPVYRTWISDLYKDKQNRLWVATSRGLFLYEDKGDTFSPVKLDGELEHTHIVTIRENSQGNLLIGTLQKGLYICNKDMHLLSHYFQDGTFASLSDNYVSAIYEDSRGQLWVGTRQTGLNRIDPYTHQVTQYTFRNSGLGNDYIRTLQEYEGKLVIGTFNGLTLLDLDTYTMERYTNYNPQKGGLSHFSVYDSYVDKANTLWIGTYAGGVCYRNVLNNRFSFYDPSLDTHEFFCILGAMAYQSPHVLWIATEGRGLLSFDLEEQVFQHYLLDADTHMVNDRNIIKSLLIEGHTIWCGTQKGTLYTFDTRTKRFTLVHSFGKEISIYTIVRGGDGALWLGTTDEAGLKRISPNGTVMEKFELADSSYFNFASIRSFLEIRKGVYLVGMHGGGLARYDSNKKEVEYYNSRQEGPHMLYDDHVTSIVKDEEDRIWIGLYNGGFCQYDEQKGITARLTVGDGLADDNICSMVVGDDRKLWLSTGSGITAFDPATNLFINYTGKNEIAIHEFSMKGGIKLPGDRIWFSGNNGLLSFFPEELRENHFIPPVAFTSLTVNNKPVTPGDPSGLLNRTLNSTREVVLKYNQNNFSIGYVALNYLYSNQNKYAYKLEGYDKEWNDAGHRNEAFYTNLKPGRYIFQVRASNNDNYWNDAGQSIAIHILTPVWQSWYAYLFYLFLVAGLSYTLYYYLHMKRKLELDLVEKQKEQQRQEEFHQSKVRMFTNFSHELRTPLTLILSPLEEVLQRVDMQANLKETLRLVYGNAQRLLLLVNQLMDLQKNQSGNLQLRVSHDDLYLFVQEIYIAFNQIAVKEQIVFHLESVQSRIEAWFDRTLLEKVLFNLLSNAFKHTVRGQSVTIRLQVFSSEQVLAQYPERKEYVVIPSSQYVCLSVEDTGKGIEETDKQHIFAPFYQGTDEEKQNTSGTGIGLSLVLSIAKLHKGAVWVENNQPKGSAFRVLIPVDREAYSDEQIIEDIPASGPVQEASVPRLPESVPTGQRYTILLAEDNVEVRQYIKTRLEPYFEVLEAENGEEAFLRITEVLPDLVVSDIMMPKMDGLQLCTLIKQDLRTGHIPVIIITAKSMVIHIKEGFQCGADDYIVKPFNMDVLLCRIQNILSARERLKELYGKKFSLESLGIQTTSVDDTFMQKFFDVIEQHIADPELNVELLCKEVGMSRANLYRKLKAITDLSPIELIRNKRMEVAARMLLETDWNVSEVSVRIGFNSHAYFATCFKAIYGMSPSEYVQQHTSN